jgi:hypothetical protein
VLSVRTRAFWIIWTACTWGSDCSLLLQLRGQSFLVFKFTWAVRCIRPTSPCNIGAVCCDWLSLICPRARSFVSSSALRWHELGFVSLLPKVECASVFSIHTIGSMFAEMLILKYPDYIVHSMPPKPLAKWMSLLANGSPSCTQAHNARCA